MTLNRPRRPGMSLLEVILALATFLLSVSGIVFLMGVAADNALESQMRSGAISVCQSRLAEVAAGAVALEGRPMGPCEDDPDFQWSMEAEPGGYDGLYNVTVSVSRKRANGTQMTCSLSQIVLDPSRVGTVFDGAKELQQPDTTADPSTTDSSGSGATAGASSGAAAPATKTGGSTPSMGGSGSTPRSGGSSPGASPKGGAPSGGKAGG